MPLQWRLGVFGRSPKRSMAPFGRPRIRHPRAMDVTQPTESLERRTGSDRRRPADDHDDAWADGATVAIPILAMPDPIAAWPLDIPPPLREVRCLDPWCQVVHRSIVGEHEGDHDEAGRAWDDAVLWLVAGHDPSGRHEGARGARSVVDYHRTLLARTEASFRQELVSVEGGRGPIVEAHLRTMASRGDRTLDIPTLLVFELASLRIRRVTEIPGDVAAWDAFWQD
jgi:hypothetical protein